jgi:hypothetical protein
MSPIELPRRRQLRSAQVSDDVGVRRAVDQLRVGAATATGVQGIDCRESVSGELEIEDVEVLGDPDGATSVVGHMPSRREYGCAFAGSELVRGYRYKSRAGTVRRDEGGA